MSQFNADYYKRFYGRGGVHDKRRIAQLGSAVHNMCAWWGVSPNLFLTLVPDLDSGAIGIAKTFRMFA